MKAMKKYVIVFMGFWAMGSYSQTVDAVKTKTVTVKNITEAEKIQLDFCKPFSLEINGLYPTLQTLPSSTDEKGTLIKSILLKNGFVKVDSGMGNWEKGPRFVYSAYTKGNCSCKVFKKYYFNKKQRDGYFDLRISERLQCNLDLFMDN